MAEKTLKIPKYTKDTYKWNIPFDPSVGLDAFREIAEAPKIDDYSDEFKEKNGYGGNTLIKKAGVKTAFSRDQTLEIYKCQTDIFYFLANYAKITTLDDGVQNFDPFQYQKNMIKMMVENRFTIFNLPRQMGKCIVKDSKIIIRNDTTGEIEEISIIDFFNFFE